MSKSVFGTALRRFREARGISQSKLAERAEFDHSYVSRLESGTRAPSRETVEFLATALGLRTEERDELRQAGGFLPSSSVGLLSLPRLAELDELHRCSDAAGKAVMEHFVDAWLALAKGAAA